MWKIKPLFKIDLKIKAYVLHALQIDLAQITPRKYASRLNLQK